MSQEIERKFLIKEDFKQKISKEEFVKESRIIQGYLNSNPERTVRVRVIDNKGYITIKGKSNKSGISRFEWEKEITLSDAMSLLELCESGVIDKTRYYIRNSDEIHTWEIDEFHGENTGLILAEIELNKETDSFDIPKWLAEEVTGDVKYYNSYLTKHPFSKW